MTCLNRIGDCQPTASAAHQGLRGLSLFFAGKATRVSFLQGQFSVRCLAPFGAVNPKSRLPPAPLGGGIAATGMSSTLATAFRGVLSGQSRTWPPLPIKKVSRYIGLTFRPRLVILNCVYGGGLGRMGYAVLSDSSSRFPGSSSFFPILF